MQSLRETFLSFPMKHHFDVKKARVSLTRAPYRWCSFSFGRLVDASPAEIRDVCGVKCHVGAIDRVGGFVSKGNVLVLEFAGEGEFPLAFEADFARGIERDHGIEAIPDIGGEGAREIPIGSLLDEIGEA